MSKQVLTRQRVLELIDQLQVGEAIPPERRLSSDLGISRLTLRAALDDLVRDGYLERRHGSGTFVSEPKIAQQLTLTSFSEDMRRRGMTAGSRTIELKEAHAGAAVGRALKLSPDDADHPHLRSRRGWRFPRTKCRARPGLAALGMHR
jgi:GntR family transcriptional regulator